MGLTDGVNSGVFRVNVSASTIAAFKLREGGAMFYQRMARVAYYLAWPFPLFAREPQPTVPHIHAVYEYFEEQIKGSPKKRSLFCSAISGVSLRCSYSTKHKSKKQHKTSGLL